MKKIIGWIKQNSATLFFLTCFVVGAAVTLSKPTKQNEVLKDYKDGIQNHLAWDIKGQCFFVRPNDDVTVYLIRVQDCDRK